jgi:hypothetical protein
MNKLHISTYFLVRKRFGTSSIFHYVYNTEEC